MRFTRREWTALIGTAPLVTAVAQAPPQSATKPGVDASGTNGAIAQVRKASEQLAGIEVPMNVEPAFSFKA